MISDQSSFAFPEDSARFLADLKANNDKVWFAENKKRYQDVIQAPAKEFVSHVEELLRERSGLVHQSRIFRIYRDLRFSKDKTPYNTHLHISFSPLERCQEGPVWFFGLEVNRLVMGCGQFAFAKDVLTAYRNAVLDGRGEQLQSIIEGLKAVGGYIHEPDLKRIPRGFDAEHQRASLLLHKGLSGWINMDVNDASLPGLVSRLGKKMNDLQPLYNWLGNLTDDQLV
ncbi:MAG TPA: hypothetical protein DCS30_14900 [Rhizobiales bacterium]|nr:hypothetical protein [Hyphomicrobiales bacterium]